jgi:hypothetical protein
MNLDNFDLNINHYDCDDIEQLFGLSYPYTSEGITHKKQELNKQILANNTLGAIKTEEIVDFLDSVADRLKKKVLNGACEPGQSQTSNFMGQTDNKGNDGTLIVPTQPQNAIPVNTYLGSGRITDQPVAPPGQINPINTHTITKLVNIDTQFRNNYYTTLSSDVHLTLPFKLDNVIQMTIQEAIMPVSWYAISESRGNNKFRINVAEPIGFDPVTAYGSGFVVPYPLSQTTEFNSYLVTIPDGNYSPPFGTEEGLEKLVDAVNDAMCQALKVAKDYPRIAYAIDTKTGKSYFYEKSVVAISLPARPEPWHTAGVGVGNTMYPIQRLLGIEFNINNDAPTNQSDYMAPLQLQCGWQLGFRNAEYRGTVNIDAVNLGVLTPTAGANPLGDWLVDAKGNPNVFISEGIALVKGPAYGYIVIDDFNNNVNQNFTQAYAESMFRNSNVMSKISLSQLQSTAAFLQTSILGTVTTRTFFGPVDIQKLHIQFLDEYGRVINLNNMDWSMTLSFICQYDK